MTVATPERTLPIRVPLLPGESLGSWLEALARRNGMSIAMLLPVFGYRPPPAPAGLITGVPAAVLRRIERQAGLPGGCLDDAVAGSHLPPGAVRGEGSRYCPECLVERDGRWPLVWRLSWASVCTTHRVLLHDHCPACGQVPRIRVSVAGLGAPATCTHPAAGGGRCRADLRDAAPQPAVGGLLGAWQQMETLLAAHSGPGTSRGGVSRVLRDLAIVAGWLLRQAPESDFARFGPATHAAWRSWRAGPHLAGGWAGRIPPASAGLTAALTALALPLIAPAAGEDEAIQQIRSQLTRGRDPHRARPPAMSAGQWRQLSALAQNRFLRALDPSMPPAERIRHRSATPHARIPTDPPGLLAARSRAIPQLLWPGWAVRLMPATGFLPIPFRATIAACLLQPGNAAYVIAPLPGGLHAYRSRVAASSFLGSLATGGHEAVFTAISCLAGYLDASGSPIDYQRRRGLVPATAIPEDQWQDLCDRASAHPGEDSRRLHASRYLYQLLTGADLNDPRCPLTFGSNADRGRYQNFTDTLTTPLRSALHDHAADCLHALGISEPVIWEPPADCCAHLALPGRDPYDIDLDAVRQLVITSQLPPGAAAEQLGTTISHIRFALEHIDRPAPEWGPNAGPSVRRWQQQADRILTREFFEREYVQARKTIRQLEAQTGFPRKYVADRARQHGITLTCASDHAPIDPAWLREQYVIRQRAYTDIAAELRVTDMTVIAAARRHGIPSRPPGVHSRPEMITTLGEHVPLDIRRAVEGSLQGWQRLDRFQAAMAFPTIESAAAHLGAHQSALVHQFRRLERDIGAQLYHRSTGRQPMRPTARGDALLQALNQAGVRAVTPPQQPRPRTAARRPAPGAKGQS